MKKSSTITMHKNMQSGRIQTNNNKLNQQYYTHQQINNKKQQKVNKKVLSQQHKGNIQKISSEKDIKNNRINLVSAKKNHNNIYTKQKYRQSSRSSKKSIKSSNNQHENILNSKRNIYTSIIDSKKKSKSNKNQKQNKQTQRIKLQKLDTCGSLTQSLSQDFQKLQVDDLVKMIQPSQFKDIHSLKLKLLNFIFKNRVVRDEQYDRLYELMVNKFPEKEEIIRSILFQIVSSLDN